MIRQEKLWSCEASLHECLEVIAVAQQLSLFGLMRLLGQWRTDDICIHLLRDLGAYHCRTCTESFFEVASDVLSRSLSELHRMLDWKWGKLSCFCLKCTSALISSYHSNEFPWRKSFSFSTVHTSSLLRWLLCRLWGILWSHALNSLQRCRSGRFSALVGTPVGAWALSFYDQERLKRPVWKFDSHAGLTMAIGGFTRVCKPLCKHNRLSRRNSHWVYGRLET